jgi:hypothetical protein
VNEFVDQCRKEWRRLGVPDPIANEMAADLAADLEEAAADGATPEEVLGVGAFDPQAFARTWAAERGVVEQPWPIPHPRPTRSHLPAAIAAFAVVAIVGAVLVIVTSSSAETTRERVLPPRLAAEDVVVSPDGRSIWVGPGDPSIFAVDTGQAGDTARVVGSVLLSAALAGILLATLFWWWHGSDRRPSRHAY